MLITKLVIDARELELLQLGFLSALLKETLSLIEIDICCELLLSLIRVELLKIILSVDLIVEG